MEDQGTYGQWLSIAHSEMTPKNTSKAQCQDFNLYSAQCSKGKAVKPSV